jgi:hypothetical protein
LTGLLRWSPSQARRPRLSRRSLARRRTGAS